MKKAFFLVLLLISVTYLFGKKIEKPQAAAQEMKIQQLSFGTAPPKYGFRIGNYRNLKNGKREQAGKICTRLFQCTFSCPFYMPLYSDFNAPTACCSGRGGSAPAVPTPRPLDITTDKASFSRWNIQQVGVAKARLRRE
ncbi:hypothetical protein ACROYT_G009269 [Oculina patagonica]